ncbi:MAG: response regulator [Pirellulales bacterium]|nr:response regulator [Pirellulales bacterium]
MKSPLVLIVEDEDDIRELVGYNLFKEGMRAAEVRTGEEGLKAVADQRPDLVLLDLMLPGLDGLAVCKKLKESSKTRDIPIIMLTAKGEEADIVRGLNLGADDYVTKPFSPKVLMARISTVLRRAAEDRTPAVADDDEPPMTFRNLSIHVGRHEVLVEGDPVELTSTEFRVLRFLARKPGWVFTRHQILDGVHGDKYAITDRAVDVQIVGLRKKLGVAGDHIETVRGVGYRFKE